MIRVPYIGEVAQVVALGMRMQEEEGLEINEYAVDQVATHLYLQDQLFVLLQGEQVVGYIGYVINSKWINPAEKEAVIVSAYIHPDHRSLKAVTDLFNQVEFAVENDHGITTILLGLGVGADRHPAYTRLFKRMGYTPSEPVLRKEL